MRLVSLVVTVGQVVVIAATIMVFLRFFRMPVWAACLVGIPVSFGLCLTLFWLLGKYTGKR